MTHSKFEDALSWFDGAAEVVRRWDDLIARYPETTWARRADVVPPEVREKLAAGG